MTGLEYEKTVAKYLRNHGYTHVTVTKASGDYGIDIIASKDGHKYAVQCKYYSSPVSLSAVQEAVAGMAVYKCDRAMVVTNNTFTSSAKALADANNVVLLSQICNSGINTKRTKSITLKIITWCVYLFFSAAVLSVVWETTVANLNIIGVLESTFITILISTPIWIKKAVKCIRISKNKHLTKTSTQASETQPVCNSNDEPNPHTQAPMCVDTEKISVFLAENGLTVSENELAVLCSLTQITASRIQRNLKWGYARSAKLIDLLEGAGYITAYDGKNPRQWLGVHK